MTAKHGNPRFRVRAKGAFRSHVHANGLGTADTATETESGRCDMLLSAGCGRATKDVHVPTRNIHGSQTYTMPRSRLAHALHSSEPVSARTCGFCHKRLPSSSGVKRHIQHTFACRKAWQAWTHAQTLAAAQTSAPPQSASSGNVTFDEDEMPTSENEPPSGRTTVEEVVDEDEILHWVDKYPGRAGEILRDGGESVFERWRRKDKEAGRSRWYPFEDKDEWELGCWIEKNIGQNQTEEFLKLKIVRTRQNIRTQESAMLTVCRYLLDRAFVPLYVQ